MSTYQSDLLRLLEERGYIHQITDASGLDALASQQIVPGYIGFDPTAPSLHIGSLVQIMMLRRLQQAGHKPIVVMGGGTGKIGDPSGRDESRRMMTDEIIADNVAGIFTVFNRLLTFDSVKLRLDREQPLTFLEFNYMILQAYDYRELAQRYGCRLQMGGSDQWGNIVNGMELARRMDGRELFGLTTPLLTTADGAKMGKTAAGAVWLNEAQLPNYDFWQYWRNVDDRDVGRFLRLFTDLPLDEIAKLESLQGAEINHAKTVLANEVTALVRGRDAADSAEKTAAKTFAGGGAGEDLPSIDVGEEGMRIGAVLTGLGFTASGGEAKRKLAENAVKLDGMTVNDPSYLVEVAPSAERKLSLGKKKHAIIRR